MSGLVTRGRDSQDEHLGGSPDDPRLAEDVLHHMAAQIGSAERLLAIVVEQGVAIRSRDVHGVVRLAGVLHGELSRREGMDEQRAEILRRSGARLGLAPEAVTITALAALMDRENGGEATLRSSELRGLLAELQREHMINRALMQVELSFLDYLMSTLAIDESGPVYDASGVSSTGATRTTGASLHVLDMEA